MKKKVKSYICWSCSLAKTSDQQFITPFLFFSFQVVNLYSTLEWKLILIFLTLQFTSTCHSTSAIFKVFLYSITVLYCIKIFRILKGVTRSSQKVNLRSKVPISSRYWNSQTQCKVKRSFLHPVFFFKAVPCSASTSHKKPSPILLCITRLLNLLLFSC